MRFLMVLASLIISSMSFAQSTLLVGEYVVVTQIDGQKISTGFFAPASRQFELPAGQHTVSAMYKRLYDLNADNHDILRSPELTLTADFKNGQTYNLVMTNQPNDYNEAKVYAKKPTLQLLKDSQVLASKTAIEGASGSLFGGVTKVIGGMFGSEGSNTVIVDSTPRPAPQQPAPAINSASTLDRFMQVWLEATPSEREKIRNWVIEK